MPKKPTLLCILDGFGYREDKTDNAIKLANTPVYDKLWSTGLRSWLKTSGLAVGLPDGQMGNSEVGHMNIGSGRVIMQNLPKINQAITNKSIEKNTVLQDFITKSSNATKTVHLLGLLSPGGVHSHQDHILALVNILQAAGLNTKIHAILDGRDTAPQSALQFVKNFEAALPAGAVIASLSGRYYAMDRDQRWDRVEKAYNAMTLAEKNLEGKSFEGENKATLNKFTSASHAIQAAYDAGLSDEFILPTPHEDYTGMQDGDSLLMANFRADRAREILTAFVDPAFDGFTREKTIKFAAQAGMVDYSVALNAFLPSLFPAETIVNSLGEIVSKAGKTQLRIAETEKYAHVTFFFNGGSETVYEGEDRILIPSPDVATYDLKPEMSAHEVTDALLKTIEAGKHDLIVVNFANPDMVGHTGVLSAAIKAVETIDACLGKLTAAIEKSGGLMFITADHGNVELMKDPETGVPHTAHTDFDVPLVVTGNMQQLQNLSLSDGSLSDLAPTLLQCLDLPQPAEMTGTSLFLKQPALSEAN